MSEDNIKKDPETTELSVESIKEDPQKALDSILSLRKEAKANRETASGFETSLNELKNNSKKTDDQLAQILNAKKDEENAKLAEDGKHQELIDKLKTELETSKTAQEKLVETNTKYEQEDLLRVAKLVKEKQTMIDKIKEVNPTQAEALSVDLPYDTIKAFADLLESKKTNLNVTQPTTGGTVKEAEPDLSKMSAQKRLEYRILNMK